MRLRLRFFAALREQLGEGEVLQCPPGMTLRDLRTLLAARGGAYAQALAATQTLLAAVDHDLRDESFTLTQDAEVAFFPPVTGG